MRGDKKGMGSRKKEWGVEKDKKSVWGDKRRGMSARGDKKKRKL